MLELVISADFRGLVQFWLVVVICGAALIWGGGPERAVAAVWLIVFQLSSAVTEYFFGTSAQRLAIDPFSAGRDFAAGALWIAIALYANRNYTLWIAGMQVLAMFGHLSRGLSEAMSPLAYAIMTEVPSWLQLLFMAIGLTRHVRRKRKYGKYRDWRIVRKSPPLSLSQFNIGERSNSMQPTSTSWRDEHK